VFRVMAASRLLVYTHTLGKPHTERCNFITLKRNTNYHSRAKYDHLYSIMPEMTSTRPADLEVVARLWFHA
jgi:hypothetical protein